jgi:hypothetical protein
MQGFGKKTCRKNVIKKTNLHGGILKWILEKYHVELINIFIWLRIGTSERDNAYWGSTK